MSREPELLLGRGRPVGIPNLEAVAFCLQIFLRDRETLRDTRTQQGGSFRRINGAMGHVVRTGIAQIDRNRPIDALMSTKSLSLAGAFRAEAGRESNDVAITAPNAT